MSLIFDFDNLLQNPLFVRNVLLPYRKDYLLATDMSKFMGPVGSGSVIELLRNEGTGKGQLVEFPLIQIFEAAINNGDDPLKGREATPVVTNDEIKLGYFRFAAGASKVDLQQLAVKFQMTELVRYTLLEQARLLNTKRIVQSFALSFPGQDYPVNPEITYATLNARILAAPLDQLNAGISRSRIIIGDDYVATQATVGAALDVGNIPINLNKLTVSHIRKGAIRAKTGKSGIITNAQFITKESPIKPAKTGMYNGWPESNYFLFTSPEGYEQLVQDAEWQAQTRRGVIENREQPSTLYGSMYKGTIEGVHVIEIPEFSDLIVTNAAGNRYVYSAFCGAGAIGYAVGQSPIFENEHEDYNIHRGIAHVEISNIKVLRYPSKSIGNRGYNTNYVNNGILHSFTTLS